MIKSFHRGKRLVQTMLPTFETINFYKQSIYSDLFSFLFRLFSAFRFTFLYIFFLFVIHNMSLNRIQKLLFSEYSDFEDMVLVESPFAETTREGRGIRQVQIGK